MPDVEYSCADSNCDLPDDDEMVSCETCRRWWHYACAGFDPNLYDTATSWFCNKADCKLVIQESHTEKASVSGAKVDDDQVLESVDILIEAAKLAQTTVEERDQEIANLKEEMNKLKLKLEEANSTTAPPVSNEDSAKDSKLAEERRQKIKEIGSKHRMLVSLNAHSTPLTKSEAKQSIRGKGESSADDSCQQTDLANLLSILNRGQVQDLPSFSGQDRREWPYFESVFKATTSEGRFSNKENVARLRKALTGEAYQLVSDRLRYSSDADAIMCSLRAIYGRADVLVHNLTGNLLKLPALASGSDMKLRQWAVALNGFVADIRSMDLAKELDNNYVLTDLTSKLSAGLYHDWQKWKLVKGNADLGVFAEFLTEKLFDLPPELTRFSKTSAVEKSASAPGPSRRVLTHQPASSFPCPKCGHAKHSLPECEDFKRLSSELRFAFTKESAICFRCLSPAPHKWRNCSEDKVCGLEGCSKRHHPLLHSSKSPLNASAQPYSPPPQVHSSHLGAKVPVMFKIVPIRLYGNNNRWVDTHAFLDDGSSITMVERELFNELELSGEPEKLTLQWTKGVSRIEDAVRTTLCASAVNKSKRHMLRDIYIVNCLELPRQSINAADLKEMYPYLRGLPLTDLHDAKPKVLLGLDQAKLLVGHAQRLGKDDEPQAVKTLLGWTVFGRSGLESKVSCVNPPRRPSQLFFHELKHQDEELHDLVKRHFTTEEFGVRPPRGDFMCKADSRALRLMEQTLTRSGCQYEIGLLWDSDDVRLPNSYPLAERRLVNLEKSLLRNPGLLDWMNQYMRDLIAKGYARIATVDELSRDWPRVWYAPTFVVFNQNKIPPKPRVVADVAAKVKGVSLNCRLLKGPDNLVPLHAGLFKFRERRVAVNADVREMFHRIRIKEEDQQCQRVLWRDGVTSRKPSVYIIQVMMFGPRCSPTSAQFVKNHHASLYLGQCPEAVDGLVNRTYVDDYFNSHDTVEAAVAVSRDAIKICKEMNFELVGFQSNSRAFLEQMPQPNVKPKLVSIDPNESESYVTKILGMFWDPLSDELLYRLREDDCTLKLMDPDAVITKREILRFLMKIFDPLGFISCLIIRGRVILQEIWREGYDWNDPISGYIRQEWFNFVACLKVLEEIRIPRSYLSWSPDAAKKNLIIFVDASEKAFAAVAYWRFEQKDRVEVAIAMAKARVAPVKKLSVPRLELQAAVLGVRVAETVKNSHSILPDEVIFVSDSKTVLSWINSSTFKFPAFVAVRVGEILDATAPHQWWFIRSADNVADDGTRWSEISDNQGCKRWFQGPDFLKLSESRWPIKPSKDISVQTNQVESEGRILVNVHRVTASYKIFDELLARFRARWSSAVRVLAFLLRFMDIWLFKKKDNDKELFATPAEILRAENWMFRRIQQEAFPTEIACLEDNRSLSPSSPLFTLSPFLDKEGTLRLCSRAQKAKTSYAARNPAILPKTHPLVDLLVQHHHEANFHSGTATTIADIRERAWIIGIRRAVERVRSRCYMCKRLRARPIMPQMGQLPDGRLDFDSRPFTHVGVDCFGPMSVKYGRGSAKRYGMIFTCLTFRAVHIEVLNDLSLDQCTMAVRRFVIIRVVSRFFYSDNGLNFVGTSNRLEKDRKEMESALGEYCAKHEGILWRFIPAYSPWMGGAWERLIQSIKSSISFVLRGSTPREDVLVNALLEAQGQINRRPLTHIPVNPEDPTPLTPNSILFGEADRDITAPGVFCANDEWSRLYSRRAQHLMREITKRWYSEYLPEITRRSKWHKTTTPITVGSIVLVVEPNEVREAWKLGRVTKIYPGPDGVVRIADVRLSGGTLMAKRSVGRLAVLDLESSPVVSDGPRDVIEPQDRTQP